LLRNANARHGIALDCNKGGEGEVVPVSVQDANLIPT